MKQAIVNAMSEEQIIRYLLNELPEEERELFEQRSLVDRQLFEYVQAIEEDLADEYVRGRLSVERKRRFEQIYKAMPGGRESIAFARELKNILNEYSAGNVLETQAIAKQPGRGLVDSLVAGWQSWVAEHRISGAVPAAAILLAALGGVSIYKIITLNRQLQEARLAQGHPNPSPSPTQLPIQGGDLIAVVPLPLGHKVPAGVRGGSGKNGETVNKRGPVRILAQGSFVELRFELSPKEFNSCDSYRVELRRDKGNAAEHIILENLKAHNITRRPELTVLLPINKFPAHSVTNYTMTFRGRSGTGEDVLREEFPVEVDTRKQ